MEPPKEFDATEVAVHLLGSIAEQVDAVKRLDREYRARVFAHLRAHYPGLLAQDIDACYRAAIADFAAQLAAYHRGEKTSFDPDRPLLPFLKTIAFRRAADFRRRCCAQEKASRGVSEAIAVAGGFVTREGPRLIEREEFGAVVREAVAGLPGQQQIVWGAIVELCAGSA